MLVLTQAFGAMWYVETLAKAVGQIVSTVAKATHVAWGRNMQGRNSVLEPRHRG